MKVGKERGKEREKEREPVVSVCNIFLCLHNLKNVNGKKKRKKEIIQ